VGCAHVSVGDATSLEEDTLNLTQINRSCDMLALLDHKFRILKVFDAPSARTDQERKGNANIENGCWCYRQQYLTI
jgi:hypothetical protein